MKINTSTNVDGTMDFRFGERGEVEENREKFFKKCGLKYESAVVMQVEHLDKITDIRLAIALQTTDSEASAGKHVEVCEALVTNQPGVPLMLLTADCYPCGIYDPVHQVVALLHLGWKPTGLKLVEKVVAHMQKEYESVPQELEVHFGPGIAKESYVAENPSQVNDPAWQPYLYDAHDRQGMHVDVLGYARAQCVSSGVPLSNIHESGIDTYASPDYFSQYRAVRTGSTNGRFATVVVL